jgi:hypothetical protein
MLGSERKTIANDTPRGEAIARLNDQLRKTMRGGHIMLTRGVRALPGFSASELARALAAYDTFDVDNDPHGERDFGDIELSGATLLWKIDYYDQRLQYASPDPADPRQTVRVLTVMLESEYRWPVSTWRD